LPEAGNETLEELEQAIAVGTPGLLAFSAADYTNTNFSLLRVLVPRIALGLATMDVYPILLKRLLQATRCTTVKRRYGSEEQAVTPRRPYGAHR
jgi:hypothetical protein